MAVLAETGVDTAEISEDEYEAEDRIVRSHNFGLMVSMYRKRYVDPYRGYPAYFHGPRYFENEFNKYPLNERDWVMSNIGVIGGNNGQVKNACAGVAALLVLIWQISS